MNRLLILLPQGARVYIEPENLEVLEVLRILVPYLTGSDGAPTAPMSGLPTEPDPPADADAPVPSGATEPSPETVEAVGTAGRATPISDAAESEMNFVVFCHEFDPRGNMRRAVVAAEGGRRYLQMKSVDQHQLAYLFSLAGWEVPENFEDTLRKVSRTLSRWMERVPGRPGRYTVNGTGRRVVLGENSGSSENTRTGSENVAKD